MRRFSSWVEISTRYTELKKNAVTYEKIQTELVIFRAGLKCNSIEQIDGVLFDKLLLLLLLGSSEKLSAFTLSLTHVVLLP